MRQFREDFPIFKTRTELVYLDSAATAQKPRAVIEAVRHFYEHGAANVHRSLYELGVEATEAFEHTRELAAQFLGAASAREIVFTKNATEALNLLAHGLASQLSAGDVLLLSEAEHHANLVPWQQTAARTGAVLKFVKLTDRGELDLFHLEELLDSTVVKIVSLAHTSNVLGTITPLTEVRKIMDRQGSDALLIADAAQSAPHFPLSVRELRCDFLVFSGHKTYGPSGVGVLWGREELLGSLPPYQTGGDMIKTVSREGATWNDLPWKFEAGTPNIEGVVGLGAALQFLMDLGMEQVGQHTAELAMYARERLEELPKLSVLGDPNPLSGIVSFTLPEIHPHDLASMLGEQGVCIRAGHHCAAPLHASLNLAASNRLSLGIYNTTEDIDRLIKAITSIRNDFARV